MPHVVKKLPPPGSTDFDEQLWPVNLALALLCGCAVGANWAISDFQSPVWYLNGYVRLVTLLLSVGLLAGAAKYLGGRRGRRLQFAAMLSLTIHLGILLAAFLNQPKNTEWGIGPRGGAGQPSASRNRHDSRLSSERSDAEIAP